MRVVIVDDDQLVALSLKTILEANEEISVVGTGNDGTEAVVLYEKERPDILLMDIQMKPMSGLAAEQILKTDRDANSDETDERTGGGGTDFKDGS